METSKLNFYKGLFFTSFIYDLVLGITFMFFALQAFTMLGIESQLEGSEPYLSLIGALLTVVGIVYFLIFKSNISNNKDLVLAGALFKFAYFIVALWYFIGGGIPHSSFFYIFGLIDLAMAILMIACYLDIKKLSD